MKNILIAIAAVSIISLGFISKNKSAVKKDMAISIAGSYSPIAVLELFTSEGCSSCPPADNLLPQLAQSDSTIISLSFHVDYWNRLGWTDPFSSSDYSERQRQYAAQLKLESIYTPQLIVNGEYEMVGSNRNGAATAIKKALEEKASVQLNITNVKKEGNKIIVTCNAEGDLKKMDLMAALLQKQVLTNVKAGENRGLKLSHTNVVRSFIKQAAATATTFTLPIPADIKDDNWQLVVYAQIKNEGKITGAIRYNPRHM